MGPADEDRPDADDLVHVPAGGELDAPPPTEKEEAPDPHGPAGGDSSMAWDGPSLMACVAALSSADDATRAAAAEALLDVPAGGAGPGERGIQWAYALVAAGAIVPLLALVQAVRRDVDGLAPLPDCAANTEAVVAGGDTALLVLAEIANVAAGMLAEEGWEVKYDEDADRPVFVDEASGMQQATPPVLSSTANDWLASTLLETLTLVQPLSVDPTTGTPRWPVHVLRHVLVGLGDDADDDADPDPTAPLDPLNCVSVLDVAVEEGEPGDRTRVLVRGPWMGSDGDVDGEVDPDEPPGTALDSWRDATAAAALALVLGQRVDSLGGEPPPRVLVMGLRCGSVPAFLCRHLPGVRVDVLEPEREVVHVGRDLFNLEFVDEPWGDLTAAGRAARLSKPPNERTFRVWSGVSPAAFFRAVPPGAFAAVLGDLPRPVGTDAAGSTSEHEGAVSETMRLVFAALAPASGMMVLAANDARTLRGAAAAATREGFSADDVCVACNPLDEAEGSEVAADVAERGPPASKRAKKENDAFRGVAARGGVVVGRRASGGRPPAALPGAFFAPETWASAVIGGLCKGRLAGGQLPFAIESANQSSAASKVVFVSYCAAAEDVDVPEVPAAALAAAAANRGNEAFGLFGDDEGADVPAEAAGAPDADVLSAAYWEEILAGTGLRCNGSGATSAPAVDLVDALQPITPSQADDIAGEGYAWGATVVPARESAALAEGVKRLVAAGWPPVCIFASDLAWLVTDRLWSHAEALLGGSGGSGDEEIVLEPSLAAFKLEAGSDSTGKRYVGNNFGQPHRDYTYADVYGVSDAGKEAEGRPGVLSVWLPLVDVSLTSGCMYVVPKSADEGQGGRLEGGAADGASGIPKFDRKGVKALAPVGAGTLLAWAGNTIHWGTGCSKESAGNPRISLAYVFRKKTATCDPRGPPLTRAECRAGLPLTRRLEVVRHAMTCFEHWYGSTTETRAKLEGGTVVGVPKGK